MHYKTVSLAICALFAAGTVSAGALLRDRDNQCAELNEACSGGIFYTDPNAPKPYCCSDSNTSTSHGIVHFCDSVVFILMLLFQCQLSVNPPLTQREIVMAIVYWFLTSSIQNKIPGRMFNLYLHTII